MLPITLGSASLRFGPLEIPYTAVTGAGVAVQTRRAMTYRSLLVAYQLPGEPKKKRILFRLQRGAEGEALVSAFRAHIADRWLGEDQLFSLRKRLGLSNALVFGIVAAIVVLTVIGVGIALAMSSKPPSTLPARPAATAPRR
jgi:hypothetical protein